METIEISVIREVELPLKIDFKLLREQKAELLAVISEASAAGQDRRADLLDGLLNMIDGIQDDAVSEETGITEEEVFGPEATE